MTATKRNIARLLAATGLAVVLVVGCWSSAFGDNPKAVITGPREAPPGELVVLDATQSSGVVDNGYLWLLVNSEKSFLPVDKGLKCVFSTGTPGDYHFVLVVAGTNPNGGPAADKAAHKLVIIGVKPPDPPPGPVVTKATRALILYETGDSTPQLQKIFQRIRNTSELSKAVEILDQEASENGSQPIAIVSKALKYLNGARLPHLVAVSSDGEFVSHADLPMSPDATVEILKSWGIGK